METQPRKTIKTGKYLGHYKILQLIDQDIFSDYYYVLNESNQICYIMKVENNLNNKKVLDHEADIIQALPKIECFPYLVLTTIIQNYNCAIYNPHGPSLRRMMKGIPGHQFTPSTSLRLSIEMLKIIKQFHQEGYIHRDIKPSSFYILPSKKFPLQLGNLGLARKFYDQMQTVPERQNCGFVGTPKYASTSAHQNLDLSRRDDLLSWFYSIIELINGSLPWSSKKKKAEIYEAKQSLNFAELKGDAGSAEMANIYLIIKNCQYEEEPKYDHIMAYLIQIMKTKNYKWTDPYDWETLSDDEICKLSIINLKSPKGEKANVPKGLPKAEMPGKELNQKKNCLLL